MNKETTELLQQLAAKLGTTAEHLWAILIRQAFISACTDLLLYASTIFLVWMCAKKFPQWLSSSNHDPDSDTHFAYIWVFAIASITAAILVIGSVMTIPDTITAFANPEYWALKQILDAVGQK
jgi:hypothetical protein